MSDPNWYKQNEKTIAMVNEHGEVMHKLFNDVARSGYKVDELMTQMNQAFSAFEMRKNPENYRSAFKKFDFKTVDSLDLSSSCPAVLRSVMQ